MIYQHQIITCITTNINDMKPNDKQKCVKNPLFKELCAYCCTEAIKDVLDRFTIPTHANYAAPSNGGEQQVLNWCRQKMIEGNLLDHSSKNPYAKSHITLGVLALFDNTDTVSESLIITEDTNGVITDIDWDDAVPKIKTKIIDTGYLYGLSGYTEILAAQTVDNGDGTWSNP